MDDWELHRREQFQREMQERREKVTRERDEDRRRWRDGREAAKTQTQQLVAEIKEEAFIDQLFANAELSLQSLRYESLFGEWAQTNEHRRTLELMEAERQTMTLANDLSVELGNNQHTNAKDYKTHEVDEFIRLKKTFGQLTAYEQAKFFKEFEAETKTLDSE